MQFILISLKSWSDAVATFTSFKTNFCPAVTIADIFMLLCVGKRLVPWPLTGLITAVIKIQRMQKSDVSVQIHLNFARTVSSTRYNTTYFTFEIMNTFQFIAMWKAFYKLIEKLLIAIKHLLITLPRYRVFLSFLSLSDSY